jgi:hypothetical protein
MHVESIDERAARSLLNKLLEESHLCKSSKDYFNPLKFTKRLRNFAPFNAMLLHVQKPGLRYAASPTTGGYGLTAVPKRTHVRF